MVNKTVIQWREKYLGKVRKKQMPDPLPQETLDIVQLQKEKQALEADVKALRKEHTDFSSRTMH